MARKLALGISGSPSSSSSSRRLVELALDRLRANGWETDVVDLATLPADALLARGEHPDVTAAIELVGEARVLVVGTPVYRATYTGLLKSIFDLMPMGHLVGKVALLIATGAAPGHMLAIDHGLRPLIASLNGVSAANAVYALPGDFLGDGAPGPELAAKVESAVAEAIALAS
jgi:FMN reductase